jgi:acyl-CoA synthetase (AMP-forming)/AMP-acid ligase II
MSRTTIPGVLAQAAARDPNGVAVVDGLRRVTFAELDTLAMRAAAGFIGLGVAPGDRIAIWAPNGVDWMVAALGAQISGAVIIPLNTRFKGEEARYILERGRAKVLVAAARFLGVDYAQMVAGYDLPHLHHVVRQDTAEAAVGEWEALLGSGSEADHALAVARRAALSPDDVSDIMFTSGTTGHPKGAVTTHAQNVQVYEVWGRAAGLKQGDRYLVLWPFFHCSGYKSGWLASLIYGASVYPVATLDLEPLLGLVEAEAITVLPGPPTLFQTLLGAPDASRRALGTVRVSVTGASSVAPSLIARMRLDLGIPIVLTAYGLTETCGTATVSDPDDDPETVANTVGRAMPGVEIRVVDEAGREVATGGAGEVLIRGFNVMRGFDGSPEETAKAIDAEGWLRTGDVGVLDARGYLRITDRLKDIYISGGFNCYPAEIEKILSGHPAVAQVAVIGVPDERLGEVGKAFILPRPGGDVSPDEVIAWSRANMANFKVPRYVEVVDALPTNATGKVQKFRLDALP